MNIASPLRYPGGKASMADLLISIKRLNLLGDRSVAEPFAGGCGASLTLLYREEATHIHINDADHAIYCFWWSLVNQGARLSKALAESEISIDEWHRQRAIYMSARRVSRVKKGFAAFFLNRCNRSGIIFNGGPIGGFEQNGRWKLGARFDKDRLLSRCRKVSEYGDRIKVSNLDGIKFMDTVDPDSTMFFIDPPYFNRGSVFKKTPLYLDTLGLGDHQRLSWILKQWEDMAWVLTYDDCSEIRQMYDSWAQVFPYRPRYTAYNSYRGAEIVIVPRWMKMPRSFTIVPPNKS